MREIKFRAWDEHNKLMNYGIEKHQIQHHALSGSRGDVFDFSDWLRHYKVMQFTGLKDKNGKEIWEGDIVVYNQCYDAPTSIGFCAGSFCQIDNLGARCWNLHELRMALLEVIGNIYEHKELLA